MGRTDFSAAEELVMERARTHGDPIETLGTTASVLDLLLGGARGVSIDPVLGQCIGMICTKLSRISRGNPGFKDHWLDIQGYAEIALKRLDDHGPP